MFFLPCWRARKLPPPGSNHCARSEKACAENSNPQGDSKGKQDPWECSQPLQSAFSCKAQAIPINPWCEISAGDNSGTGFPCSAFAGGSWVGDRTHPFGTKMLLQAVLPRHGCPGTAFHGVGSNLQDLPTLSHHHPHAQHPKFLWCLNQNQKQVDFPGPSAPLHEPGVRNSSGVSLPSETTHIFS